MFKNLLSKIMLVTAITVSSLSANAALISQDIISAANGVVGSITINTLPSVDAGGGFGSVEQFESFSLFGSDLLNADTAMGQLFYAEYDKANAQAGIQFMQFDLNDDFALPNTWAFNGIMEAGLNNGLVDIFDVASGNFIGFFDDLSFGQASVIPEPAAIALLLIGLASLRLRRKV